MTDLHARRVEASARALHETADRAWDEIPDDWRRAFLETATAALAAADAVVGETHWLAPREPDGFALAAMYEWALEWMKKNGVDGLSPWSDYPPLNDTTRGMLTAYRDAYLGEGEVNKKTVAKTGWRPIETAPKDGIDVLVYVRRSNGKHLIAQACNVTGNQWWAPNIGAMKPEFWMPLPEAPARDLEEGK